MHIKDAGVAAFVAKAHPLDSDNRCVLRGDSELHMLLSAHAVSVARLVSQESLVLHIQPTNLPQGFTSFPHYNAGQSEGLPHLSFQMLWCGYSA